MKSIVKAKPKRQKSVSVSPSRSPTKNMNIDDVAAKSKKYQLEQQEILQKEIMQRFKANAVIPKQKSDKVKQVKQIKQVNQISQPIMETYKKPTAPNYSYDEINKFEQDITFTKIDKSNTPQPFLEQLKELSLQELSLSPEIIKNSSFKGIYIKQPSLQNKQNLEQQNQNQNQSKDLVLQQLIADNLQYQKDIKHISTDNIDLKEKIQLLESLQNQTFDQVKPIKLSIAVQAMTLSLEKSIQTKSVEIELDYQQTQPTYQHPTTSLHLDNFSYITDAQLLTNFNNTNDDLIQQKQKFSELQQNTLYTNNQLDQIFSQIATLKSNFETEKSNLINENSLILAEKNSHLDRQNAQIKHLNDQLRKQQTELQTLTSQASHLQTQISKYQNFKETAFLRLNDFYNEIGVESTQKFSNLRNLAEEIKNWRNGNKSFQEKYDFQLAENERIRSEIENLTGKTTQKLHENQVLISEKCSKIEETEKKNLFLEQKIEEVESQIVIKKQKYDDESTKNLSLMVHCSESDKKIRELESQNLELKNENQLSRVQNLNLQKQYEQLQNQSLEQFQMQQKQIDQVQNNFELKCKQVKNLQASMTISHKKQGNNLVEQLQEDLLMQRQQLASQESQFNKEFNQLQQRKNALQEEITIFKKTLSDICIKYNIVQDIVVLEKFMSELYTQQDLDDKLEELKIKLDQQEDKINKQNIVIEENNNTIQEFNINFVKIKEQNKNLQKQIIDNDCINLQIDEQEKKIVALELQLRNFISDRTDLQKEIREFQYKLDKKEQEIVELKDEVQIANKYNTQPLDESYREQISLLQSTNVQENALFIDQVNSLQQKIISKDESLKQLQMNVQKQNQQIILIQEQNENLQSQNKKLSEQNYTLEQRLQKQLVFTTTTTSQNDQLKNLVEYKDQSQKILELENQILGQKQIEFFEHVVQTQSTQQIDLQSSQIVNNENESQIQNYKQIIVANQTLITKLEDGNKTLTQSNSNQSILIQKLKFNIEELETNNQQIRNQNKLYLSDIDNLQNQNSNLNKVILQTTSLINMKEIELNELISQNKLSNELIAQLNEEIHQHINFKENVEKYQTDLADLLKLLYEKEKIIEKLSLS